MDAEEILTALTGIFALGVGCQWLASRLRLPSILLLLTAGIVAGPVTGQINPDALLGDLLLPIVSLGVAVVLFEGSLSLRYGELRQIGRPLLMLLTVGVAVTWILCSFGAWVLLDFDLSKSLLLGAILTVTGPTVIGPLLQHIRPIGEVGPIARWEGIVIDPIGAVLAVLVFSAEDAVEAANYNFAAAAMAVGFLKTAAIGIVLGCVCAAGLVWLLRKHFIADHLQSPFALMLVLTAFTASNQIQHESGLFTVTVMGLWLANQTTVTIRHIVEFKENLTVLLISCLFIVLAARLPAGSFADLGWRSLAFVAFTILVARPLSVFLSTVGTKLSMPERGFLAFLAPRGIVAAAVASVFALEMGGADDLVAAVFSVIIGTVIAYGLLSGPLARKLGLSVTNPQGVLIAGAGTAARAIATALQDEGITVRLVDTNAHNLRKARMAGLPCTYANVLSDVLLEKLDLGGIGRFVALTPNDEVNSLAAGRFEELFGRVECYRLPTRSSGKERHTASEHVLSGRVLFGPHTNADYLRTQLDEGAVIKSTRLTDEFAFSDFLQRYGEEAVPLFEISDSGSVSIRTRDNTTPPKSGTRLIALVSLPTATEAAEPDTSDAGGQ